MTTPTVLVATGHDGLFNYSGGTRHHELGGMSVRALAADGHGGALVIVGGHSLFRRNSNGEWQKIAANDNELACAVAVEDMIYVGTDDARVLRLADDGKLEQLRGFDAVEGRDTWFAGSAVINGQVVGPPLGVRSMSATADGSVLLANVHVGGIPRSADGGVSWRPTIDVASDVHEVCAHPTRPEIVIAAAAIGLCISRDGGMTWSVEQEGMHAAYCSAVAFAGDDVLVSASEDHFAATGAVYRRRISEHGPLQPVAGLPRWSNGIVDTDCLAARGPFLAVADKAGNLYVSTDDGRTWSCPSDNFPTPSAVLIV